MNQEATNLKRKWWKIRKKAREKPFERDFLVECEANTQNQGKKCVRDENSTKCGDTKEMGFA